MKLSIHRVTAAVVMGVSFGLYRYHMHLTWGRRGLDAFMSDQMRAWDMYVTHPRSLTFTITSGVILSAFVFGFYELITILLSRLLPPQPSAK